jgi:hypothetical protein
MSTLRAKLFGLLTVLFLIPSRLLAEGKISNEVLVADTRHLHGLEAWWGNLYNDSRVQFALLTIIVIPTSGVILGLIADQFMKRLGIDLKKRSLSEH